MNNILFILSFFFINSCKTDAAMNKQASDQTLIIKAVQNNQLNLVEKELKNGINVNTRDKNNKSLLLLATHANNIKMAELLVSYKADVNLQDDHQDSAFLYAGASGYTVLVKLFLANGARFDVFNRYNGTALIPACERGHLAVVQILAQTKGFPIDHVNRLGWTALMEAVILGDGSKKYVDIVQILLDANCNVSIADHQGISPLQHASAKGYLEIAKILERATQRR